MEIKKSLYSTYSHIILIILFGIGVPAFTTIMVAYDDGGHQGNWILPILLWLIFSPCIYFIHGILKSSRHKIIIDSQGVMIEENSPLKLYWSEIIEFKELSHTKYHTFSNVVLKPDSLYLIEYWKDQTSLGRKFNRFIGEKENYVSIRLNGYNKKPEKILSDLKKNLSINRD